MLRKAEINQCSFKGTRAICLSLLLLCFALELRATPVPTSLSDDNLGTSTTSDTSESTIDNDLYVIKAVVYEIGILTDANNSTENNTERQEELNISFYDRGLDTNGSPLLDWSPVPIFDARNITS